MEKFINVGMTAVKSHHHGTAATVLTDDFTRYIKNLHKGNRTGRRTGHILHFTSLGTEIGNINPDTSSIRENPRNLSIGTENRFQIILGRRKYIAIGHGYLELPLRTGSIQSSSGRTKFGILQITPHTTAE